MSFNQRELMDKSKELVVKGLVSAETLSKQLAQRIAKLREEDEDLDEHCGIALGVILTLFGGQFANTFAFFEAFKQSGFKDLVEHGRLIKEQINRAEYAVEEDAKLDEDRNGIADVLELSPSEAAERKVQVFVKNVDPEVVRKALSALWISFLSASAAVKLKFATIIALGASLGEFLDKPVQKYLLPRLKQILDLKYHKWLPSALSYLSRVIGVALAFRLNSVLATVATSIRGGELLLQSINSLCVKRNMQFLTKGPADEMLALSVVACGVYAQLVGPKSSLLVRVALFPLTLSESLLTMWVAS